MIDIHSHTLWHLDDGSPDLETTVEMCRIAVKNGVDTLFLTPHLMYWNSADELYDRREQKIDRLNSILDDENIALRLVPGFEIYCDDDIFDIKYFKPYTLNSSRYILIEFDFFKTTEDDVFSWCNYLISNELVPIIAHPERYKFILSDEDALARLSKLGVLFQINCGSPIGMFGEKESILSIKMLNSGFADFIASDAHNANGRSTDLSSMMDYYPDTVETEYLTRATQINPQIVLNDEQLFTFYRKDLKK